MKTSRLAILACLGLMAVACGPMAAAETPTAGVAVARAAPDAGLADTADGLWGTRERRSAELTAFKKWTGVVARVHAQRRPETAACVGACPVTHWRAFLAALEGREERYQINAVNRYLNAVGYVPDMRNNGIADNWATPAEFLGRGGDCEDYAIAKYFSLRALGFAAEALRIVVLQDLSLGIAHAVLVVDHDGQTLLLDNRLKRVVAADKVGHYRPRYSINERHWWRHQAPATPDRLAAATAVTR